jgi:hypothetical protein
MVLQSFVMLSICVVILQARRSGTVVAGGTQCSRMAPETAEKANPASPATSEPANTETTITISVKLTGGKEVNCAKVDRDTWIWLCIKSSARSRVVMGGSVQERVIPEVKGA